MGPLPYSWQNVVLVAVQAALVALPAAGLPAIARPFVGRAWSLVLPASIVVVVGVLAVLPGAADGLTWLALVAVPILAGAALGWGMHGARAWLGVLAVPVFALAIAAEGDPAGDLAALFLTALSCVALGRLLAGVVAGVEEPEGGAARRPSALTWIRLALVAMAVIDAILVFSSALEAPNDALNAAVPAAELPRLQFVTFEGASMGYGDVFVAATLGAVLAAEGARRRIQVAAALATLVLSLLFDLLFGVPGIHTLPATVPVAAVTLLFGGWRGWGARSAAHAGAAPAPAAGGDAAP